MSPTSEYHVDKPCLIYDGVCNLCTTATRIIHALDRGWRFQYLASQQLSRGVRIQYGLSESALQGQMYLIRTDHSIVGGSAAVAEICNALLPFRFLSSLLRTSQAHRLYGWIALRRYRLFGCRDTCYVGFAAKRQAVRITNSIPSGSDRNKRSESLL